MDVSEIKTEVEDLRGRKVKLEENSLSVVYEVEVTSKVDIKPKEEYPSQTYPIFATNVKLLSTLDIKVKPDQNPTSDELELEPEPVNTSDRESEIDNGSESDSNKQHSHQIPQKSQRSSTKSNRNISKRKKLLHCTLCSQSFPRIGLLITHTRVQHGTIKNPSSESISDDEDETASRCPLCSKPLGSVRSLQDHFLRFHIKNKLLQCSACLKSTNEVKIFPTESLLKKHIASVHDPARYRFQCDICSLKFNQRSHYTRHKAKHLEKQYKCEYCSNAYRNQDSMLRHIIAIHKEYTERHETFKCGECEQLFCSQKDLEWHVLQTHVEGTVQCKICFKKFREEGELSRHLTVAHRENRTWLACDVCSKVFKNNKELIEHLEVEHKRFFKCRKCFRSFLSKEKHNSHSTETFNKKGKITKRSQLQCKICLIFFSTECTYTTHKHTHLNSSKIERKIITQLDPNDPQDCLMKCDFCAKSFVEKSLLLDHARKCHPNQKLKCKSCEKSFPVKFQLNKHELLHSSNKPFECQVCHKGFVKLLYLKSHENIHKMDRKYKCSQCEKSFAVSCNLKVHMANHHGGAKPFKCDICKKSFVFIHYLLDHSRVHRDEGPFSCSKCSFSCKHGSTLRRHQERRHSDVPKKKYKKGKSHPVLRGLHLKYFEDLVYVCSAKKCEFETNDEKEVAIHYAKHKLPKVILPRLLYGSAGEVFLSKSTPMNKLVIQARYKCAQCLKTFVSPDSLRNHTKMSHNRKQAKREKRTYRVSTSSSDVEET